MEGVREMGDELYQQVYKGYQIIKNLSHDFPVNNNPYEMILGPLLTEQSTMFWNSLLLLQEDLFPKKRLSETISVLYRSNEAFDPTYRAWIRASKWMDSVNPLVLRQKKELAKELRESLKAAVPSIERIYGENETKFIIPPLFR